MAEKRKIMVVDDEPEIVALIKNFLAEYEYEVSSAKDGEEAFQLIKQFRPDLIVLDLHMPRMGGLSFYECVHSMFPRFAPPVLIVTGHPEVFEDFAPGIRQRDGLLTKPFTLPDLLTKIERMLAQTTQSDYYRQAG